MVNPGWAEAPFRDDIDFQPLTDRGDLLVINDKDTVVRRYNPMAELEYYQDAIIDGLDPKLHTTLVGFEKLAQLALTHYNKLEEFGADILPQNYVIGQDSSIYVVTDFISSSPVDRQDFPVLLTKERVVKPLLRYYEWLCDSKQSFGLLDLVGLPRLEYYSGEQFSLSDDGQRLFLHDTPPTVFPTTSRYYQRETSREACELWEYGSAMELRIPDEEFEQMEQDFLRVIEKVDSLGR